MSEDEESYKDKDVAFYSATLTAWYTTKFEKDKHLLSLSTAGIGLLVTLATTVGVTQVCTAAMYVLAVISFLVCILSVLIIFGRNANHLQHLVSGTEDRDSILSLLDKLASSSFVFGIIFTLLVGLFSSIDKIKIQEAVMAKDSEKMVNTSTTTIERSVDGASAMRPSKPPSKPASDQSSNSSSSDSSKK